MPTIPELIEAARIVYKSSEDAEQLKRASGRLRKLLKEDSPNGENLKEAEQLICRLKAKELVVNYIEFFEPKKGETLKKQLPALSTLAMDKSYGELYAFLDSLAALAAKLCPIMDEAFSRLESIRADGEFVCGYDLAFSTEYFFDGAIKSAKDLRDDCAFPSKGGLLSLRDAAVDALVSEKNALSDYLAELKKRDGERLIREKAVIEKGEYFEYYPVFNDRVTANTIVLRTPFSDEARLYALALANIEEKKLAVVDATALSREESLALFAALNNGKTRVLLTNLDKSRYADELFESIASAGKQGLEIFVTDCSKEGRLYADFMRAISKCDKISALDVGCRYLTMPYFLEVAELFESKGLISGREEYEELKKYPFMGYIGLNEISKLASSGKDWKAYAKERSDKNRLLARDYVKALPSIAQLIDGGWGFSAAIVTPDEKREFSYDDVRGVNTENVRKIRECGANIFRTCGMLVRYCLLGGEDKSIWARLDAEEREGRLTAATKCVMRELNTGLDPIVEIVPKDDESMKSFGGLCCEGGKLIKYREDCSRNYDYISGCICHECFHAFQHISINSWKPWYFEELGVTPGRTEEWAHNFQHYNGDTSSWAYKLEIVEADARAFEVDCFSFGDDLWSTIDFV